MKKLENITVMQAVRHLADDIACDRDVSRRRAEKLLANALTYNTVAAAIRRKVDELLEE